MREFRDRENFPGFDSNEPGGEWKAWLYWAVPQKDEIIGWLQETLLLPPELTKVR